MYFIILCFDQPHVGELREKTRPAHLEYLKQHAGLMHLGGPMETTMAASSAHFSS